MECGVSLFCKANQGSQSKFKLQMAKINSLSVPDGKPIRKTNQSLNYNKEKLMRFELDL